LQLRAAAPTGDGLGVEAAIGRIAILARAIVAQGEFLHRGISPIVGQRFDDREARSAIGAVGKGITETPIVRVEDFAQAIVAGRDIGQNERAFPTLIGAFSDLKPCVTNGIELRRSAALNDGARRFFLAQPAREI
jgi:hypothetical protein